MCKPFEGFLKVKGSGEMMIARRVRNSPTKRSFSLVVRLSEFCALPWIYISPKPNMLSLRHGGKKLNLLQKITSDRKKKKKKKNVPSCVN